MAETSSLAGAPGGEPRRRVPKLESGDQLNTATGLELGGANGAVSGSGRA
jgi:hypothetical protein